MSLRKKKNLKTQKIKAERTPRAALSLFKGRFPTWQQVFPVFLTILFSVVFWSVLNFLRELPSYLMRMRIWEIVGVFSYTQVFAILESIILVLVLILIAELLPYQLFLEHFTVQAALAGILGTFWIIPLHYKSQILAAFPVLENSWAAVVWFGFFVALVIAFSVLFRRYSRIEQAFQKFIDKLTTVSLLYFIVGLSSLVVILIRNLVAAFS
jgi:hypothetical protein